jgi:hypothetical protein
MKSECKITLLADVLGRALGIEASHVRKIPSRTLKAPTPPYRPPALNEDEITAVVAFIKSGHSSQNYVTQRDVLRFLETNYQKFRTYQWLSHFLKVDGDLLCRSVVCPSENVRLQVPRDNLEPYVRLIREHVPLVPTELFFALDKSGFRDWEDRKPESVLTATGAQRTTPHYPACQNIAKHEYVV